MQKKKKPCAVTGPFFLKNFTIYGTEKYRASSNLQWIGCQTYFGWNVIDMEDKPHWSQNILTGRYSNVNSIPWWYISDFNSDIGDIKNIWEASRFAWIIAFSQQIVLGESEYVDRLNEWLNDWIKYNSPYYGVNWKCGQEASIRVIHLAAAALLLKQVQSGLPNLLSLIEIHLQRIFPTTMYAVAQNNNHGISEGAALFIGGSWLMNKNHPKGKKWYRKGRKLLENRLKNLIEDDGSFSQYSTNYHRLVLDTCSFVEVWRRKNKLPAFSCVFYEKIKAATFWLISMVQDGGDAPNLGANDGAHILNFGSEDYRDYRPTVQLAAVLFCNKYVWGEEGIWNSSLHWLAIDIPCNQIGPIDELQNFKSGGYHLLRKEKLFVLLRYPRFRFRPAQSDILHLDFWCGQDNFLRDSGTLSYYSNDFEGDLASVAAHNTVQFDDREQMPRLGRFLWGAWPKATDVLSRRERDKLFCSAGYTDFQGASHLRQVSLFENRLCVIDKIDGFAEKAILRWHLYPTDWRIEGNQIRSDKGVLTFSADVSFNLDLRFVFESRYYQQKSSIPVLELVVQEACVITTIYQL